MMLVPTYEDAGTGCKVNIAIERCAQLVVI